MNYSVRPVQPIDILLVEDSPADARLMREALAKKGADLRYVEAAGHQHNEAAWSARFGGVLEYLFPAKEATPPNPS